MAARFSRPGWVAPRSVEILPDHRKESQNLFRRTRDAAIRRRFGDFEVGPGTPSRLSTLPTLAFRLPPPPSTLTRRRRSSVACASSHCPPRASSSSSTPLRSGFERSKS